LARQWNKGMGASKIEEKRYLERGKVGDSSQESNKEDIKNSNELI